MQLQHVIGAVRRFKVLTATVLLAFVGAGALLAFSRTPTYEAGAILVASPPNAADSSIASVQFMLPAVIQQVTTARFREAVLNRVPAAYRASDIAIGATQDQGTGIIHVTASGLDPALLPPVSNAAAKQLIQSKLTPTVKLALLQPAVRASSNTASTRTPILVATFLLGLIAAVFSSLAANALRTETVGEDDLWRRLDLEVVAAVPKRDSRAAGAVATAFEDPSQFEFTEAFHRLVATLQATGAFGRATRLAVISCVGGEGKTTVASGLAYALALNQPGAVVAVDADLRRPALHRSFGIPDLDRPAWDHDLAVATGLENLAVVPAARSDDQHPTKIVSQRLPRLFEAHANASIIVDTPPFLPVPEATLIAHMVDAVIVVIEPGRTKMAQLEQTLHDLRRANVTVLGAVLNRVQRPARSPYGSAYGHPVGGTQRSFLVDLALELNRPTLRPIAPPAPGRGGAQA